MHNRPGRISTSPIVTASLRCLPCLAVASTMLVSACNNDVTPADATLNITPDTHTTRITEQQNEEGLCLYDDSHFVDIPILMRLNADNGSPIGDAELNVYVDFAENTYSGLQTLQLYDDLNGNGVVDEQVEYISGVDDDIARVRTGKRSGSRMLLLRINLSCSFQGEVFAYVDGVSARAEIEVVAEDIVQPEVLDEDEGSR